MVNVLLHNIHVDAESSDIQKEEVCNKKHLYNTKSEKHEDVVDEFGTLFLQYEPAYYWWEVTVIFKKSEWL